MRVRSVLVGLLASTLGAIPLYAQGSVSLAGRQIQVHWYLSEGFASSTDNNFLTMDTSRGSLFTEAGINVSTKLMPRLRVGAQLFDRYMGELGKGHLYLDWAEADFRAKDWLGFRAGKVKTTIGLYSDTQGQAFLQTWAFLPQGAYPADLRSTTAAHVGGDVYGHVTTTHAGSFSYTGFAGSIPGDEHGGYLFGIEAAGGHLTEAFTGRTAGIDVRWMTPLPGLMAGTTWVHNHYDFAATFGTAVVPFAYSSTQDHVASVFGDYTNGNFHADAEYRDQSGRGGLTAQTPGATTRINTTKQPSWFVSSAYRFSKWLEAGTYYSHYHVEVDNSIVTLAGPGRDHIFDKVVTARVNVAPFWSFKVEGHFMDGVGSPTQAHGFYPQTNPDGLQRTTNMLVIRTTVYF